VNLIGFNKGLREQAGIEVGDEVTVELERDDEPRGVDAPSVLRQALAADPAAAAGPEGRYSPAQGGQGLEMLKAGKRHP
jgi:hypothetical protein